MAQKILSTGVLVRDATVNAHIEVCNLSQSGNREVMVEIFDWGVDQLWDKPEPVLVSPPGRVTVGPHTFRSFIALITDSTAQPGTRLSHYEVRITVSNIKDVVVNCFAIDSSARVITGNTVLHAGLVEIA